jgi:hypothetical protein
LPSNSKSKEKPEFVALSADEVFLEKANFVIVLQLFKVKLTEGFAGICLSFFPQYFTKAMLLGELQEKFPLSME